MVTTLAVGSWRSWGKEGEGGVGVGGLGVLGPTSAREGVWAVSAKALLEASDLVSSFWSQKRRMESWTTYSWSWSSGVEAVSAWVRQASTRRVR